MVDRDVASELPGYIAAIEAGLAPSTDEWINKLLLRGATIWRKPNLSEAEADIRAETYPNLLRDIPHDILGQAFKLAGMHHAFFPTVAEIRAEAQTLLADRQCRLIAARRLLAKHQAEYREPEPPHVWTAEEIEQANATFQKLGLETRYQLGENGEAQPA